MPARRQFLCNGDPGRQVSARSAAGDEEGLWLYHVGIILTSAVKVSSRDVVNIGVVAQPKNRQPVLCKKKHPKQLCTFGKYSRQ